MLKGKPAFLRKKGEKIRHGDWRNNSLVQILLSRFLWWYKYSYPSSFDEIKKKYMDISLYTNGINSSFDFSENVE
jgi:hypothetical protein